MLTDTETIPGWLPPSVTYRQLDYWMRRGWLYPSNGRTPGSGNPRRWDDTELAVAELIGRLRIAGLEMETAVRTARALYGGARTVRLGPGIELTAGEPQ